MENVLALTSNFELSESSWYLDAETGEIRFTGDGVEDETPQDIDDSVARDITRKKATNIEVAVGETSLSIARRFVCSVERAASRAASVVRKSAMG